MNVAGSLLRLADQRPRRHGLQALRGMLATWRRRLCFRRQLAYMVKVTPHLIDDIGMTRRQAEAEIAKPFWQE